MAPRRTTWLALTSGIALLATAGCSSGFGGDGDTEQKTGAQQELTVLIGTSGDAETAAASLSCPRLFPRPSLSLMPSPTTASVRS